MVVEYEGMLDTTGGSVNQQSPWCAAFGHTNTGAFTGSLLVPVPTIGTTKAPDSTCTRKL